MRNIAKTGYNVNTKDHSLWRGKTKKQSDMAYVPGKSFFIIKEECVRKIRLIALLLLAVLVVGGCPLFGKKADVYVTAGSDNPPGTLRTVKFIPPAANAGSYSNQYSENIGTVSVSGYTWYHYEVAAGTYDAYIEWTGGSAPNGRARITVDPDSSLNEWAAVYTDQSGNVWGETGGGAFAPLLPQWP